MRTIIKAFLSLGNLSFSHYIYTDIHTQEKIQSNSLDWFLVHNSFERCIMLREISPSICPTIYCLYLLAESKRAFQLCYALSTAISLTLSKRTMLYIYTLQLRPTTIPFQLYGSRSVLTYLQADTVSDKKRREKLTAIQLTKFCAGVFDVSVTAKPMDTFNNFLNKVVVMSFCSL